MLNRKINLIWLLMMMALTSYIVFSGFIFYNWANSNNLRPVEIPTRGIFTDPPGFLFNIEDHRPGDSLNNPLSVVARENKVYVTDSKKDRINVYTNKGKYLFSFGERGVKEGQFLYPNTIAADDKGNIYVGEFQNQRIQVFKENGQFFKSYLSDRDRDIVPLALTVKNNKIYVVNKSGHITVLDLNGKLISEFGLQGTGEGQFKFPNGIAVAQDGRIFVSDSGNSRIQVFSAKGKYLQTLEDRQSSLSLPRGITIDDLGHLYVVDIFNHKISVYDVNLRYLFSFGERGIEAGQVNFPNDIYVDDEFRIYVTDRGNNRIAVFSY